MKAMLVAAVLVVSCHGIALAADPNQFPTYPALGQYSNFFSLVCGKKKVDTAPATIPRVGCFAMKSGTSMTGDIEGRSVRIDVDASSDETLFLDGSEYIKTRLGGTSDGRVLVGSSTYAFCRKDDREDCPTQIDVLNRIAGDFIIFSVSRKFAPQSYVTNEENLEAEESRRRSH